MAKQISKRAFDLTVGHEVTSKAYYEKHYMRPEWPGLSSGPTVGIGYDLGQASPTKIRNDWRGLVSDAMLEVMVSCSGFVGEAGRKKTAEVKNKISIPWDKAMVVFANRDVPTWTAGVLQRVPGSDKLPPSCLGVLVDLAYNRGHSWDKPGDRYAEMRAIKADVGAGRLGLVPGEIKKMKRLWPNTAGLLRRCDDRIALWQYGVANEQPDTKTELPVAPAIPDSTVPQSAGPARTKPPATSTAQNTTTAAIIVAGGAGAAQAAHTGALGPAAAVGLAVAAAAVAALVWWLWHRNRNPA